MITVRSAKERGQARLDWLDSRHTFSFDRYYDPNHMGFRTLRVINEDRVAPGKGFETHSHRDMEILTYVLEGSVAHRDSMGNETVIVPGEVQRMSAGSGISHSEYNPSRTASLHFLQIWILPERRGLRPTYQQRAFDPAETRGHWRVVASRDAVNGSLTVHQDVRLSVARLEPDEELSYDLPADRHAWLQVARGTGAFNGYLIEAGDGLAVSGEESLQLRAETSSEYLLFDLA